MKTIDYLRPGIAGFVFALALRRRRPNQAVFYLIAALLVVIALLVRLYIAPYDAGLQYLTFFPAIALSAVIGGLFPGLFATLLGLLSATFVFTAPYWSISLEALKNAFWPDLVFIGDGLIVSFSIEAMHRFQRKYFDELEEVKMSDLALQKEVAGHIESETRLQAMLNTSAIGIVVIDEQGCIEQFNPVSESIFGYARDEAVGQNVNMLMTEPHRSSHDRYLKNYLAGGGRHIIGLSREVSGRRKDGSAIALELNVGEACLKAHNIFVGFVQDISSRKQAENASRQFQAIVESSDDAIISKTLDGLITSWNAGAEAMFGYRAGDMLGGSMLRLFPPERVGEEEACLRQIAEGQRVSHFETVRIRKDGLPIDVSVSLSPTFDDTGQIAGVSAIVRDISASKRLERELQAAKQAAEAANRSKSEFLANMSHEIRTPMNAIIGLAQLTAATQLTPQQHDYLGKIQAASQALLEILNDILDLSRIESGRMEIERIEFDPTLILQGVSDLFIAKAEEKGLQIFLDVAPDIPRTLMGDPLRIRQILGNLVSNAIKFTDQGEVHIRMELLDNFGDELLLRLGVRDTGIGISAAARSRLFQNFSQADPSITRKFGGSGLGLAISKQLAELLGGAIAVSSQPGQGSLFTFTARCGKGRPYNWQADSHHLKGTRVLVIDDQPTSCTLLRNTLESWQFQVVTALSAEQGLAEIDAAEQSGAPFDLLLLDWQIDGMDGLALIGALGEKQRQGVLQRLPAIIMVTACNKEQLLSESASRSLHFEALLTKPVLPSSLLNAILHAFRQPGKSQAIAEAPGVDPYVAARPLQGAHILLVEDNALNQQVAGELLNKAGMRVSIANHGGEALQRLQRESFDAVLMDLQMPEMDGFEAARRIRQLPACRDLPIIAMTAAAMSHDRQTCLDAGMNDHVAKPIKVPVLIATLLRWIKPGAPASSGPLPARPADRREWAALQAALPGFKLDDILSILSGNQPLLIGMLRAFREHSIGEAPAIAAAIASGKLDEAKMRLHTLKGTAGNLGAQALYRVCAALKSRLNDGEPDAAALAAWTVCFDSTMDAIASLPASAAVSAPDARPLGQALGELDALLSKGRFIDDALLAEIKALLPEERQAGHARLTQAIIDTDYASARALLKTQVGWQNDAA